MSDKILDDADDAKEFILKRSQENMAARGRIVSGVIIEAEHEIDGHTLWKYSLQGVPLPRMLNDHWVRDDGKTFSILGCTQHRIEQVVRGEVLGPHHKVEDD